MRKLQRAVPYGGEDAGALREQRDLLEVGLAELQVERPREVRGGGLGGEADLPGQLLRDRAQRGVGARDDVLRAAQPVHRVVAAHADRVVAVRPVHVLDGRHVAREQLGAAGGERQPQLGAERRQRGEVEVRAVVEGQLAQRRRGEPPVHPNVRERRERGRREGGAVGLDGKGGKGRDGQLEPPPVGAGGICRTVPAGTRPGSSMPLIAASSRHSAGLP